MFYVFLKVHLIVNHIIVISYTCFFNYNVNNPLTVDELFNQIKFNEFAFINNNKDVVITIKTI